ncbi:MAG: hypothetical protein JKY70_05090 [Mucilaginibacter sp.]|nr:hypothetical protein [Mucilaginibacter sp.]
MAITLRPYHIRLVAANRDIMVDTLMRSNDTSAYYDALVRFRSTLIASRIFRNAAGHVSDFHVNDYQGNDLLDKLSNALVDSLSNDVNDIQHRLHY